MAEKKDLKWWIEAIRAFLAMLAGLLGAGAYETML